MKKKATFFKSVLEEVKKISITDIVEEYVTVKRNPYSDNDAHCPFHADESFGSFKLNDEMNIYKCFSCGEGGNGIRFVMEMEKIEYKEAVMKIAYMHNIVTKSQAEAYFKGVSGDTKVRPVERKARAKSDDVVDKASVEVLDGLFSAFMDTCTLSEAHQEILKGRGLSDEEIQVGGFFTFPEASQDFLLRFYKTMAERGLDSQELKHVPGFVTADHYGEMKNGQKKYLYVFTNKKGIGIPVRNSHGQVVGIQIRQDDVDKDQKRYTWFSSTYAQHKNIYKHGTPAGAPLHTTYSNGERFNNVVFITEGIFKSIAISKHFGSTAISLQGVGNFQEIVEELNGIEKKQGEIKYIFVAHDADMVENVNVYLHLKKLVNQIKEAFPHIKFYNAMWDESYGKGIDDLIHNQETAHLKRVDMDEFMAAYDSIIEPLEKAYQKKIRNIDKNVIRTVVQEKVFKLFMTA